MRRLGDLAAHDLLQRIYALALGRERVHEMHDGGCPFLEVVRTCVWVRVCQAGTGRAALVGLIFMVDWGSSVECSKASMCVLPRKLALALPYRTPYRTSND